MHNLKWPEVNIFRKFMYSSQNVLELYVKVINPRNIVKSNLPIKSKFIHLFVVVLLVPVCSERLGGVFDSGLLSSF